MARMRDSERGTGVSDQAKVGAVAWAWGSCDLPISRARRPPRATKAAAIGRIVSKCSTARAVTTSKLAGLFAARDSARVVCISISVNVMERVTSRRKTDFFWLDSMRVT